MHPIITKGGDIVNVIPSEVELETLIRAKTISGITDTNKKVNSALAGSAIAMGASVEIEDMPGYLPYKQDENISLLIKNAALELVGDSEICETGHVAFSTDLGEPRYLLVKTSFGGGIAGASFS